MVNVEDHTVKKNIKVSLLGKSISLKNIDFILSGIDNSLDVITKNIKLYFYQKYDLLIKKIKQNNYYNKLSGYYFIDHEEAFYHFFEFIDIADKQVFHLLNKLGIEDSSANVIDWNSDVIKKKYYEEITFIFRKIYSIDVKLNSKYSKVFDMASGKYADIFYNNISDKYDYTLLDLDISKYNNEQLFDYYNKILNDVIDKSLLIYKNTMFLLIVDYLRGNNSDYNVVYEKLIDKKYINSFYDVKHSKHYEDTLINNVAKYPFIVKNYYLISSYVKEDDYKNFKKIIEYLDIKNIICDVMNVDNHNYIYENFNLTDNEKYKELVGLYCYLTNEDLTTYVTRHMLLIQKEEIDKMLLMIEAEGTISRINLLFNQIVEKNKQFEDALNKSCISKAEFAQIDKRVQEQKTTIRNNNIIHTLMYLTALGIIIYEIIKLLK